MTEIPDTRRSLLLRIRDRGNQEAWEEFLDIYQPLVYRLARRHGFQDADARDLTQEVFATIVSAIEGWDPDPARGSFRGWLYRISRNLLINTLASKERRIRGTGDTELNLLLEQQPADSDTEETGFDLEYRREVFRWAARKVQGEVHPTTWTAFWRTSVEGRSPEEVAMVLGKSVGVVYAARSRVMARLRARIERFEQR